jgi:putative oxidoreductase
MSNELTELGRDIGLLVLRVGAGAMMLFGHGWGKFSALMAGKAGSFPDPIGLGSEVSMVLAVFAEFVCAILLVLGLGTRLAAIPLLVTMLVAGFVVHGADPWGEKEMALLYAVSYLTLLLTGPGRISLDALVTRLWND